MEKIIEIKNLTKRYGDLVALDDFSLDVYEGEILGLLGPNGSAASYRYRCPLPRSGYGNHVRCSMQRLRISG